MVTQGPRRDCDNLSFYPLGRKFGPVIVEVGQLEVMALLPAAWELGRLQMGYRAWVTAGWGMRWGYGRGKDKPSLLSSS